MKECTASFLSHDKDGNPVHIIANSLAIIHIPFDKDMLKGKKCIPVEKEIENLEKRVSETRKFLDNKAFIEKAPTEVVEGRKESLAKMEHMLSIMKKFKDGVDMDEASEQHKKFLELCKKDPMMASLKEWLERENCKIEE